MMKDQCMYHYGIYHYPYMYSTCDLYVYMCVGHVYRHVYRVCMRHVYRVYWRHAYRVCFRHVYRRGLTERGEMT